MSPVIPGQPELLFGRLSAAMFSRSRSATMDGVAPNAALGTGLAGLADRVAAVDGRFQIESPPGGPTVLRAEIPCGPEGE